MCLSRYDFSLNRDKRPTKKVFSSSRWRGLMYSDEGHAAMGSMKVPGAICCRAGKHQTDRQSTIAKGNTPSPPFSLFLSLYQLYVLCTVRLLAAQNYDISRKPDSGAAFPSTCIQMLSCKPRSNYSFPYVLAWFVCDPFGYLVIME